MGADGGTIPTRGELVKSKKKEVKQDPSIRNSARWRFCALSAQKLEPPIVACELGQLFQREALMKALLAIKEGSMERPVALKHIKKLKDVHVLNVTAADPSASDDSKWSSTHDIAAPLFKCPILGLPTNGRYKFVYSVRCGCVVSQRAVREIPTKTCLVCNAPVGENDYVIINGDQDDMQGMKMCMKLRKEAAKREKKERKKEGTTTAATETTTATSMPSSSSSAVVKAEEGDASTEETAQSLASSSSLAERTKLDKSDPDYERFMAQAKVIKRRADHNSSKSSADNPRKKQPKINVAIDKDKYKWALSGKSVADNPNASGVMKKLFHSSSDKDMNELKTFTARSGYARNII